MKALIGNRLLEARSISRTGYFGKPEEYLLQEVVQKPYIRVLFCTKTKDGTNGKLWIEEDPFHSEKASYYWEWERAGQKDEERGVGNFFFDHRIKVLYFLPSGYASRERWKISP